MGYFSSGSEGADYEEQYCTRCVHYPECAVWALQLTYNYDEVNKPDSMLHWLIPRSEDGLRNEKCRMFHAGPEIKESVPLPLKGTVARLKNRVVNKAMEGA